MELIKIIGVGLIVTVSSLLLKSTKPELSFAVTVTGIIVVLLMLVDSFKDTAATLYEVSLLANTDNTLIKLLLKIVGIGYIAEFGAGILKEFGSETMADKIILAGKLTVITLSLPLIKSVLTLLGEFLKLV